jgi:hypothetical protein
MNEWEQRIRAACGSPHLSQRVKNDFVACIAELAALRKDAERYRWLREGCNEKQSAASRIAADCYGMEWDAKIDAAMAVAPAVGAA